MLKIEQKQKLKNNKRLEYNRNKIISQQNRIETETEK